MDVHFASMGPRSRGTTRRPPVDDVSTPCAEALAARTAADGAHDEPPRRSASGGNAHLACLARPRGSATSPRTEAQRSASPPGGLEEHCDVPEERGGAEVSATWRRHQDPAHRDVWFQAAKRSLPAASRLDLNAVGKGLRKPTSASSGPDELCEPGRDISAASHVRGSTPAWTPPRRTARRPRAAPRSGRGTRSQG